MKLLAVALTAAVALAACGAAPAPRVVRRIGGERRAGAFVSPYQYEWFVRAEIAQSYGRYEEAAEAYRMALAGAEEDPLVIARLAEVVDRLGQREEAERLLAEGHEAHPGSESLWLATARIAARRGDHDRAIAAYQRAEQAAPDSETPAIELARLLRERGAAERADSVLERFARRAGGGTPGAARARLALALARGDAASAASAVEGLLRVAPARAEEVRQAAESALRGGRPDVAVRLLERVPRRSGDEGLRVRALIEAGRGEEAEGLLAIAPEEAFGSILEEARLHLAVGRPARAEELAATAAQTGSGPVARVVEGRAALAQGRFVEAAAAFVSVPHGAGGFADARIGLADTLAAQGLDNLAAESLGHTLTLGSDDDVAVSIALADLRARRGDTDGALAALEPHDDLRAAAARARLLDGAGRTEEAARAYAALMVDDATLGARTLTRARAEHLVAEGDRPGAIRILRRWLARAPEDLATRRRLDQLTE